MARLTVFFAKNGWLAKWEGMKKKKKSKKAKSTAKKKKREVWDAFVLLQGNYLFMAFLKKSRVNLLFFFYFEKKGVQCCGGEWACAGRDSVFLKLNKEKKNKDLFMFKKKFCIPFFVLFLFYFFSRISLQTQSRSRTSFYWLNLEKIFL